MGSQTGGKRWGRASLAGLHRLDRTSRVPGTEDGSEGGISGEGRSGRAQVDTGVVWSERPGSGGGRRGSPISEFYQNGGSV